MRIVISGIMVHILVTLDGNTRQYNACAVGSAGGQLFLPGKNDMTNGFGAFLA